MKSRRNGSKISGEQAEEGEHDCPRARTNPDAINRRL